MSRTFLLCALLVLIGCGDGGGDPYAGLRTTRVEDGTSFTNCYFIPTGSEPRTRLLIVISGSGYTSVLGEFAEGDWLWRGDAGVFAGSRHFNRSYDLLVPEKTNVEMGRDHGGDPRVLETYTVEDRCRTMAQAIEAFLTSPDSAPYDTICLFGQSQGGGLVPRIYDELRSKQRIDKVVIASAGPGLSLYDMFLGFRQDPTTPPADMRYYRELEDVYARVQSNPDSIDELWWDDPYKMWHSFFDYRPLDHLTKIDVPILVVQGKDDSSSLPAGSRIAVDEFARLRKTNLTYLELEGGHFCWVDNLETLSDWMAE